MNQNASTPPVVPVILCGGSGTRLWPLSRQLYPKPFVRLKGGHTLFDDTLERARLLGGASLPLVVSNDAHRFYILEALKHQEMEADIILEPAARNTAPAIALAAFALADRGGDALMLAMPSDHFFGDAGQFCATVAKAAPTAASGRIVTFGIRPTRPDSAYGYIEQGKALNDACHEVRRFVEKPDGHTAAAMLRNGGYFWNSGIFLMPASLFLAELERLAPDIHAACAKAWANMSIDDKFTRPDTAAFLQSPEDSIDYAVMEKTSLAAMTPLDCDWSDMGSWDAFFQTGQRDGSGNVTVGDVMLEDVENSYVHAENRLVAAVGMRDVVVVECSDAVLVLPRERAQEVKKIVSELKRGNREECQLHPLVYRPWGSYERLAAGSRFQVKRIIVKPGGSLSLQLHHHRSEHWIVVRGTAEITLDETTKLFTENQSVYIPLGCRHKLHNPGIIPLELIEVQSGSYLGEDDIQRLEDAYGRK